MSKDIDTAQILHVNKLKHVQSAVHHASAYREVRNTLKGRSCEVHWLSTTLRDHIRSLHTHARSIFGRSQALKIHHLLGRTLMLSHHRRQDRARSQNMRQPGATISSIVGDPVSCPQGGPRCCRASDTSLKPSRNCTGRAAITLRKVSD